MMVLSGIYKGDRKKPYNFKNSKTGEPVVGTSHNGYVEVEDRNLDPDQLVKKVKINLDYEIKAKVGELVNWSIDVRNDALILVEEILKSK